MIESLRILAQQSIMGTDGNIYRLSFGSFAKKGFGRVRLNIEREGKPIFEITDTPNIFDITAVDIRQQRELEVEAVEAFNEWLEKLDYDTFTLPLRNLQGNEGEKKGKK